MTIAEKNAIGAALKSSEALAELCTLSPKDFGDSLSQLIAKTVMDMYKNRETVDLMTVSAKFEGRNDAAIIQLAECISVTPSTANHKAYVQGVRTESNRRSLQALGAKLVNHANSMEYTPEELGAEAEAILKSMGSADGVTAQGEVIAAYLDGWNNREKTSKGKAYTGLKSFDRLTGGIEGPKLVVVGARPAVGKSALALQMAIQTAKEGTGVLYISLEMTPRELIARGIAQEGEVNNTVVERYCPNEAEEKRIHQTAGSIAGYPIYYIERANTPEKIRSAALGIKGKLGLIVIDYLQLMTSAQRSNSRTEEVAQISRALKLLAMDLDIPIIALSQLNRESQSTLGGKLSNRRPTMAQLRESGAIEQDADIVVLLWQPESGDGLDDFNKDRFERCVESRDRKYTVLMVEKNRGGETGDVPTAFIGKYVTFTESIPLKESKEPSPWARMG